MSVKTGEPVSDLVVIVPGILGTRLIKNGQEVWGTTLFRLFANLITAGRRIRRDLAIPEDVDPDQRVVDGVTTNGLITGIAGIPGLFAVDFYDQLRAGLINDLELKPGQIVDFPYDWRLSCRTTGAHLAAFLECQVTEYRMCSGITDAGAILVCHSMGGLVARWCADRAEGAKYISTIITIGTPHKGSIQALDAIANGVRLPRRVGLDLTAMALSLPALYELLPTYSCVEVRGALQPLSDVGVRSAVQACCPVEVKDLDTRMERGLSFHRELAESPASSGPTGYQLICLRGADHPTPVWSALLEKRLELLDQRRGGVHGGDGVVPTDSGVPAFWTQTSWAKSARGLHSTMASGTDVREEIRVALRHTGRLQDDSVPISVAMPTEAAAGAGHTVVYEAVPDASGRRSPLNLRLEVKRIDEPAPPVIRRSTKGGDGYHTKAVELRPGLYRQRLVRDNAAARTVPMTEDWLVVYDPQVTDL